MDETMQKIQTAILEQLGIADLPEEMQADFVDELGGMILTAVIARGVESLAEEQRAEVMTFAGSGEEVLEKTITYLGNNLEDFGAIMDEESQRILTSWNEATRAASA
jgi:hypothetical protein